MKIFYLNDETARRSGYCYREGDKMALVNAGCNVFKVSPGTTYREAVRILLSHQKTIV